MTLPEIVLNDAYSMVTDQSAFYVYEALGPAEERLRCSVMRECRSITGDTIRLMARTPCILSINDETERPVSNYLRTTTGCSVPQTPEAVNEAAFKIAELQLGLAVLHLANIQ